jgi:hypothetical protein
VTISNRFVIIQLRVAMSTPMPNRFTPKVGLKLGGLPVVMFILIGFRDPGVLGSLAVTYALIG